MPMDVAFFIHCTLSSFSQGVKAIDEFMIDFYYALLQKNRRPFERALDPPLGTLSGRTGRKSSFRRRMVVRFYVSRETPCMIRARGDRRVPTNAQRRC